jgi:16S rRNA (cytidine1402-2'-O)-methyltransferase
MTYRAVNVLRKVEIIAAEDTRHSRGLLNHFAIAGPRLVALHEHNEMERASELIQCAIDGESTAIISDAGTPMISDPGLSVIRAAWEARIRVVPIPGASALTAALSVSPFGAMGCMFVGFLPARTKVLEALLNDLSLHPGAVVFFEAPHRIVTTLQVLERLLPTRRVLIGRELTKLHETLLLGTASELLPQIQGEHRGEFICIIEGKGDSPKDSSSVDTTVLEQALASLLPPRQVAKVLAKVSGVDSRTVYRRLMSSQHASDPSALESAED